MTSVVSEKSNNNTENNVANNLASKLTYEKCPQDIMQILLKSRIDDSNVGKNASENIVADEIWEHQQYNSKLGTWGSTDEHFGGGGLKRWWSPIGGSSNDVKNVLPILSTTRDLARHGGQAFNILSKWHVDHATVNTDICGWSYTRFFDGGLQQESFANNNEDNNNNSNNGNNNSNENLNTSTSGGDDAPEWFKEHNIFSQVRRRRWVRLKCLANVREGCAAWLADRIRTLDVINTFRDEVEEAVYENQRYLPIVGYGGGANLLLTDPGAYCNYDQSFSQTEDPKENDKKIPEWEWKTSWKVKPNEDGNADGWMYAINFADYTDEFKGVTQPRAMLDYVRRRAWIRIRNYCGNVPDQNVVDTSSMLEKISSTLETEDATQFRYDGNDGNKVRNDGGKTKVSQRRGSVEDAVPFFWPRATSEDAVNTWRELDRQEVQKYYQVRGKNYMKDRKKVSSNGSLAVLAACEFFNVGDKVQLHALKRRKRNTYLKAARNRGDTSFYYVINVITPSPPHHTLMMYYRMPPVDKMPKHFQQMWKNFLTKDDEFRNQRWKIIPRIAEGPWVVKSAVGTKPALLGLKVDQKYYITDNYCEVDIDVASSQVATMLTGLIIASIQQLTIDLAFTLEGRVEDELQEEIIGTIRLKKVDLRATKRCNDFEGMEDEKK